MNIDEKERLEIVDILKFYRLHIGVDKERINYLIGVVTNLDDSWSVKQKAENIIERVSKCTGIPVEKIKSKDRHRDVTTARQYAMYIIHKKYHVEERLLTTIYIASMFGRDHATVLHAKNTISDLLQMNDPLVDVIHNAYQKGIIIDKDELQYA
jgi:chromosomal replication initiation ATPase DnaA